MKPAVNLSQLDQTSFDSATPDGNCVVAHPIDEPGSYIIAHQRGRQPLRSRSLRVRARDADSSGVIAPGLKFRGGDVLASAASGSGAATGGTDVNGENVDLETGGYVSFTGPRGNGETARLQRFSARGRHRTVWSTARLGDRDVFALSIARPGRYRITNTVDKMAGTIVVTYPELGRKGYRPADPVRIVCGPRGFDVKLVELGPLQGLVVNIETKARITVDLVEPDDGPVTKGPGTKPERPELKGRRRVATLDRTSSKRR